MGSVSENQQIGAEELLPGLPDALTIEHISTRVPWGKLYALSKTWRHAIRSGQVYEARVRSNASRTLIAMIHCSPTQKPRTSLYDEYEEFHEFLPHILPFFDQSLSLYNPTADTWHSLPPIPDVDVGIPHNCELVYLKHTGKLYLLGGGDEASNTGSRKQAYSLDLWSNQHVWKRCADMSTPRERFSSGVMNGKLYVFGGECHRRLFRPPEWCAAEMYDPEEDIWSPIAPMLHASAEEVLVVDEALTLDGFFLVRGHFEGHYEGPFKEPAVERRFVEIYNPYKDQWGKLERDINTFGPGTHMMTVDGNFYFFEKNHVIRYDFRTRSPSSQVNSLKIIDEPRKLDDGHVCTAAPAGDGEVLTLHRWPRNQWSHWNQAAILLKSKGLGSKTCSLQWEKVSCGFVLFYGK
ncbi:hypothetical protein R1sor_022907 [Riccia sorocarpa]|uniref:Kelch repeat-containing protein n=1 Tax=Riccia sorocarpa TaxID=122646 RepID=A0ABD3GMY8_9MARC